ncbi:FHA domain-containing protein [Nostoc sp. UHCC 0702]|nr:FHA domain-containing protein [Nostoc sp. UHCC 0702]
MSVKINKLLKCVQDVQNFVATRNISIDQALKELGESLKAGKLIMQIVGQDLSQVQAFQKLLGLSDKLYDIYQLKIATFPQIPDPNAPLPTPNLVLQSSSNIQQPVQYELTATQTQIIGRNPSVAQLLLPDNLNLISGHHAEIQPLPEGGWQIRDLGSRNGTFINGNLQILQNWYTLKLGDQICLGSASQGLGSATLIFEKPSIEDIHPSYIDVQRLLNCNILCLIIPDEPLSETVQRFIQLAKDAQIAKLFVVVDKPGSIADDVFQETFMEIENSIKRQLQEFPFELIALLLQPFVPTSGATIITPHAQPEFEQFCDILEGLSKDKTEEILTKWATYKLNQQINYSESILIQQDAALKEKLQKDEEKFKELTQNNLKKQVEKVYKKVDSDRDLFFKQVKTELNQSKSGLLDEFRQSSLPYKIQQFTKQLQPTVSDQGGYRYIRLKVGSNATASKSANYVHATATELCHTELTRWAAAEWNRIGSEYAGGGLDSLFKKSYESLNFIPDLMLPDEGFSNSQTLSIQTLLDVSSVEPTADLRYKQVGFWGYMFKNLRGQIITIVGTITMLGSGFIGSNAKVILIPALIPITLAMVWLSHKQEKEAKVEEVAEKLQKETANYYQSYVKGLVDRLMQRIGGLLEFEERRFRETLENVKETYAAHIIELEKNQNQLKSQLEDLKRSGPNKVEKELAELRKLKQSI